MGPMSWKTCIHAFLLIVLLALPSGALALEAAPVEHPAPAHTISLASTKTLIPTGNATLRQAHPNAKHDTASPLILGRVDGGRARALMEFNIGDIPLGATINSATLRLYQTGYRDVAGSVRTIYVDRVTSPWHEAVATWNCAPTVGGAVGSVRVAMNIGWYQIDVTDIVRDWYTGASPNYGLTLRGYESDGDVYRLFVPRSYVNQPELVVNYTLQPATLGVTSNAVSIVTDGHRVVPPTTLVRVQNRGTGEINWTLSTSAGGWLQVSPTSGTTSASYATPLHISILPNALSPGTHTGQVTIRAPGLPSSPQIIQVTVEYTDASPSTTYLPFVTKNSGGAPPSPVDLGKMMALMVGISDYEHLDPPPDADELTGDWGFDLQNVHQVPHHLHKAVSAGSQLRSENARIQVDAEAALSKIEQGFGWMDDQEESLPCGLAGMGTQSCSCQTAVWSYAGHGGQDLGGAYIITAYDTDDPNGDFVREIPGSMLDGWLDQLDAQNVLVVIDSCHSGGLLPALSQPGRVVLTSARSDQAAWETTEFNGTVFSHYLVQALMDPGADTDHDGYISAQEAYSYAAGRTDSYIYALTNHTHHQNPQMYNGLTGPLRLTELPCCGPLAAELSVTQGEHQPLEDVVSVSGDLTPIPIRVRPLQ